MKKLMLLMLVLFSLPSMAQSNLMEDSLSAVSDVVVDTLEVLNVEPVQNINYLTINADQQGSMIYVNDEFAGFDTVTKLLNISAKRSIANRQRVLYNICKEICLQGISLFQEE